MQATERIVKLFTDPQDPAVASMLMGRLLHVMHDRMHAAAESAAESPVKVSLWSGHDTTLIPVLVMLGHSVTRWPPFASSLVRAGLCLCACACVRVFVCGTDSKTSCWCRFVPVSRHTIKLLIRWAVATSQAGSSCGGILHWT